MLTRKSFLGELDGDLGTLKRRVVAIIDKLPLRDDRRALVDREAATLLWILWLANAREEDKLSKPPPARSAAARKWLERAQTLATKLHEHLKDVPPEVFRAMSSEKNFRTAEEMAEHLSGDRTRVKLWHPLGLKLVLEWFNDDASSALAKLPAPSPGRAPDALANAITRQAATCFQRLTGLAAKVEIIDDKRHGAFLDFVSYLFEAFEIEASPAAQIEAQRRRAYSQKTAGTIKS